MIQNARPHVFLVISGFLIAVFTAASVMCFFMVNVIALFELKGIFYVFLQNFEYLQKYFPIAVQMTALYGFPGWLAAVILAEKFTIRQKYWFALAGAVNTLLALLISGELSLFSPRFFSILFGSLPLIACGFLAGLAYWRVAGWRSGIWRKGPNEGTPAKHATAAHAGKFERFAIRAARIYSGLIVGSLIAEWGLWLKGTSVFAETSDTYAAEGLKQLAGTLDTAGLYLFYPAVFAFLIAAWRGNRSSWSHAGYGTVVALGAFFLLLATGGFSVHDTQIPALAVDTIFIALCGAANGFVYWLIAVPGTNPLFSWLVPPNAPSSGS